MNTQSHKLTTTGEKPLVSVCLLCYNQKDFIINALKALVDQSYDPLEIIISDDVSSDGSSELIREYLDHHAVDGKINGKRIVYNRNTTNLGNLKNSDMCYSLASGDLLVKADGDDISEPNRAEEIVKAWVKDPVAIKVLYSDVMSMTEDGVEYGRRHNHGKLLGAAATYHKSCYREFNSIQFPDAWEDVVYYYRALMLGRAEWVDSVGVKYRIGSGASTSVGNYRQSMIKCFRKGQSSYRQLLLDLDYLKHRRSDLDLSQVEEKVKSAFADGEANLNLWNGNTFSERWTGFKHAHSTSHFTIAFLIQCLLLLPRKIGDKLVDALYAIKIKISGGRKLADWRY